MKKGPNEGIMARTENYAQNMDHKKEDKHYFKLHIDSSKKEVGGHEVPVKNEEKLEEIEMKRTVKDILRDAIRQIVASAIILLIGIIILNWSAYSRIAKHEIQKLFGAEETPLQDLIKEQPVEDSSSVLRASNDPEIQKKQIPDLNLEVTPPDNRIIIPRINENIPIVRISSESLVRRDWGAMEAEMQDALKDGVVHYPGTSLPGQDGNSVITGHSSYFPWDPGRFKDVFALLHNVVQGDKIVVFWEQQKYVYEVEEIKVVLPQDIEVLKQTPEDRLTLITCTPVGTNLKRLIVVAKPITEDQDIQGKVLR